MYGKLLILSKCYDVKLNFIDNAFSITVSSFSPFSPSYPLISGCYGTISNIVGPFIYLNSANIHKSYVLIFVSSIYFYSFYY